MKKFMFWIYVLDFQWGLHVSLEKTLNFRSPYPTRLWGERFHFDLNLLVQWKPIIIRGQSLLYLKEGISLELNFVLKTHHREKKVNLSTWNDLSFHLLSPALIHPMCQSLFLMDSSTAPLLPQEPLQLYDHAGGGCSTITTRIIG